MKYIIPLLLMSTVAHATPLSKTLHVSTIIDMNRLYSSSIKQATFEPSSFDLLLNSSERGFESVASTLFIETSIPKEVESISFSITLVQNESSCLNWDGSKVIQPDFVTVGIDNTTMALDIPVLLSDFNSDNGISKTSKHFFTLDFKSFELIDTPSMAQTCTGNMAVEIGVDI